MQSYYPLLIWITGSLALLSCHSSPFSEEAERALSTFQLAEGFSIELFASEPLVADPVAMEVDENGRVYVVEMHGYPLDTEGSGKVKLLSDTDGDGLPDQSTLFADGLVLPTGIMRWKQGVLVTDAPNVWYLADTTADGVADIREVVLTGFARSNPQHNLNTPVYGLDNWIYLAHEGTVSTKFFPEQYGGEGQKISFPDHPGTSLAVNANGRNVRFRPDTYELEEMSGESQFGQAFDAWGHQLLTSNATHLYHEVLAGRYLSRNPNLSLGDARSYLPTYGPGVEVYPITQNPEHQLLTDVGTITSACGVTWYQGNLFPDEFRQITFVAEPVHNLVHTDFIRDHGATFQAERMLDDQEFLASQDSWFRPVNFYVGPEGALYVLDYYRQIIEHPEWMSEEVNQSGALYNGTNQGRIYRIVPEGKTGSNFIDGLSAGQFTDEELVSRLSHPNLWWRRTAQRLLLDRRSDSLPERLREAIAHSESATGTVHALWTLEGLGQLDQEVVRQALSHSEAGVRENAIKLAELHLNDFPEIVPELYRLQNDPHPKVRFQLLCTLGSVQDTEAGAVREALLLQDLEDEWTHYAALSASSPETDWLQFARRELTVQPSEAAASFLQKLGSQIGKSGNVASIKATIELSTSGNRSQSWWHAALLTGLSDGIASSTTASGTWHTEQQKLLATIRPAYPVEARRASLNLLGRMGGLPAPLVRQPLAEARRALRDTTASLDWRRDALTFLGLVAPQKYQQQFIDILSPHSPTALQLEAVDMLNKSPGTTPCESLLNHWASLTPSVRDRAVNVFMNGPDRMHLLLAAVQESKIDPSTVGWRRTVHLMNHDNDSIRIEARQVFAGSEQTTASVESYLSELSSPGNVEAGKTVFQQSCATCHQVQGEGEALGPDLAAVRNRSKEAILRDILQPNKSIADGYELWRVTLQDSTTLSGIIASETSASLNLRDLAGNETTVHRSTIADLKALDYSAMPEGLAQQISKESMNDLLTFLKEN